MKFCIATIRIITDFDRLVEIIKEGGQEGGFVVQGVSLVPGFGCANLGLMLDGPEEELMNYVSQLTMVLMPAKFSRVDDDDPGVKEGEFYRSKSMDA